MLLDLWEALKPTGFAPGRLPFAGGPAEQPACVMAALDVVAGAERALKDAFPQAFQRPDTSTAQAAAD